MIEALYLLLAALLGWAVGALPIGRLVARGAKDKTLLCGTGNIGPFIWFMAGHKGIAIFAFLLEVGKIMAAMHIGWLLATPPILGLLLAGLAGVIGHGYSPFMGFLPCRSSSVYTGFSLGVSLWAGAVVGLVWIGVYLYGHNQHKAIAAQLFCIPLMLFLSGGPWAGVCGLGLLGYGMYHHRIFKEVIG